MLLAPRLHWIELNGSSGSEDGGHPLDDKMGPVVQVKYNSTTVAALPATAAEEKASSNEFPNFGENGMEEGGVGFSNEFSMDDGGLDSP